MEKEEYGKCLCFDCKTKFCWDFNPRNLRCPECNSLNVASAEFIWDRVD